MLLISRSLEVTEQYNILAMANSTSGSFRFLDYLSIFAHHLLLCVTCRRLSHAEFKCELHTECRVRRKAREVSYCKFKALSIP